MNFLRGLGIVVISFVVVVASLLFLCFSACAVATGMSNADRTGWGVVAIVDLVVIIGGVYAIKKLHRFTPK